MKAIGYIRVSTQGQVEDGVSLDAQEAKIRAWAELNDVQEVVIFKDEGIPGKRADRPGLLAALDALTKGACLVVTKLDRLSRDTFLSCWIEKEVKKVRSRIISLAGEGSDGSEDDPGKMLLRRMTSAFAEYERLIIGQRTKAVLTYKRSKGEKTGGDVPFGYHLDGIHLVEDENEQKAINLIRDLRAKGYTLQAICDELEKEGYKTRRGLLKWQPKTVGRIIERLAA